MVGEVEVRVVGPDRVRDVPGHAAYALAVAGHERDPVADQADQGGVVEARPPGSKISTVALWRGAEGVSAVRKTRSRARSRSPMLTPSPRYLSRMGF